MYEREGEEEEGDVTMFRGKGLHTNVREQGTDERMTL